MNFGETGLCRMSHNAFKPLPVDISERYISRLPMVHSLDETQDRAGFKMRLS